MPNTKQDMKTGDTVTFKGRNHRMFPCCDIVGKIIEIDNNDAVVQETVFSNTYLKWNVPLSLLRKI